MTVLARVREADLTPELTLNADKLVGFADAGLDFWGVVGFPIHIKGRGSTGVWVTQRYGSWVVEACCSRFPSAEELARRPPTPPSPTPTLEEFRRSLGLDP